MATEQLGSKVSSAAPTWNLSPQKKMYMVVQSGLQAIGVKN